MTKSIASFLAVSLLALSPAGAAPAEGRTVRRATADGRFVVTMDYGGDPFHPEIEQVTLSDDAGRTLWAGGRFGQNDCWVAADGRSVVGLRGAGVEGMPGTLTFFGPTGAALRTVAVAGFAGGAFTRDGGLFVCRTGDRGIAAFDREGGEVWAVPIGSQYLASDDGRWLAVVRNGRIELYRDGAAAGGFPLDAPFFVDGGFVANGEALAIRTATTAIRYGLRTGRVTAQRPTGDRTPAPRPGIDRTSAVSWPLADIDAAHPLGNGWGEYQWYGGAPYFHPGVDVMGITVGVPVYAVAHGWVKAWLTTSGEWHWRLAIADSSIDYADSCDGWLYAHIDSLRPHAAVGDEVFPGDQIGYLVEWPVTGFDHCHFARIRDAGAVWGNAGADWKFQDDPLNSLAPNTDTAMPVIEQALAGSKFAFCRNNTSQYLRPDNLTGDADIIARIHDRFGLALPSYPDWEKLNPYRVEYAIHGAGGAVPRTASFLFAHQLDYANLDLVNAVFKQDDSCVTYGDYDYRQYYYIVTNGDGDTVLEANDTAGCWRTSLFANGQYWVVVYASDQYGNTTADSQLVTVANPGGVAQSAAAAAPIPSGLRLSGPNPFSSGTAVRCRNGSAGPVRLAVYDLQGRLVRTLADGWRPAGTFEASWDGRDDRGRRLAAGTYLVRFSAGGTARAGKLLLVR